MSQALQIFLIGFLFIVSVTLIGMFWQVPADHYEGEMHYKVFNGISVVNITEDSLRVALLKNQYNILK